MPGKKKFSFKSWARTPRSPSDKAFQRLERVESETEPADHQAAPVMAAEAGKRPGGRQTEEDVMGEMKEFKRELISLITTGQKDLTKAVENTRKDLSCQMVKNGERIDKLTAEVNKTFQLALQNEQAIKQQREELDVVKKKLIYLEDYTRRPNIKLMNFEIRRRDLKHEVLEWLNSFLSPQLAEQDIERIHYVGKPREGCPRPIIVRFATYMHKERLMATVRANADLLKRGDKMVQIYQDLSSESLAWRHSMRPLTAILIQHGLKYSWGHPVFLKIWRGAIQHRIYSLEEGRQLLKAWNIQTEVPSLSSTAAAPGKPSTSG